MSDYDLVVIGAGPGGYTAAIRASQLGMKTAIVEKGAIGGTCLNRGCIPTKVLIEQAEIFKTIKKSSGYGIFADFSNFDYSAVLAKTFAAIEKLVVGIEFLLKTNGVEVVKGKVEKIDAGGVYLENQKIHCKNILIATGSEPASVNGFEIDGEQVINSDTALFLSSLPTSVAIVGAGAIGVEFAYIFSSFGCEVYLIEMAQEILPGIERDVSKEVAKSFKRDKIRVYTESQAQIIQKSDKSVRLKIVAANREQNVEVEKVLIAVGRKPVINFELPKEIKIDNKRFFIEVDKGYKTAVESIYAIGDIVNTPLLAHVASREGEVAVENMAGLVGENIDFSSIPYAVYSQPQVAGFGHSSVLEPNENIGSQIMFFKAVGKAVAVEKTNGLLKLYYNKKTRFIEGAHLCGHNASEIIHELIVAKESKMTIEKLAQTVHAHPSFSEIIVEVAKEICYGKQKI